MSKAVLISIRPVWCGKIFSGQKNLEFRKSKPYFPTSFKCYVYCTARRERLLEIIKDGDDVYGTEYHGKPVFIKTPDSTPYWMVDGCKKVVGEFTVDRIEEITVGGENIGFPVAFYGDLPFMNHPLELESGGITLGEYLKYKGKGKVYGWHISDYKLYDKPKEVSDFRFAGCTDKVKRPPQSWCYVEELEEE